MNVLNELSILSFFSLSTFYQYLSLIQKRNIDQWFHCPQQWIQCTCEETKIFDDQAIFGEKDISS